MSAQRYTTYERDNNGGDEAQMRRYQSRWTRFSQPDPYEGSYNLSDPQSFNRYSYVSNDPVNQVDPSGLTTLIAGIGIGPPPSVVNVPISFGTDGAGWLRGIGDFGGGTILDELPPGEGLSGVDQNLGQIFDDSALGPPPPWKETPLHCLEVIRKAMENAWIRSRKDNLNIEAGFLAVRLSDGSVATVNLPNTNQPDRISGDVTIPPGSTPIAIFHTHPNNRGRYPSQGEGKDESYARDKKYPFYVITGRGLTVYNPPGSTMSGLPLGQASLANNLSEWLKGTGASCKIN